MNEHDDLDQDEDRSLGRKLLRTGLGALLVSESVVREVVKELPAEAASALETVVRAATRTHRDAQRAKTSSPSSKSGHREASSSDTSQSAHPTSAAADHVSEMARSESATDAITSKLRFGRFRRNADSTGKPVAAESP